MGRRLFKELERSYGFDDVAIVPGEGTINPDMTSTKMTIGDQTFDINSMFIFRYLDTSYWWHKSNG